MQIRDIIKKIEQFAPIETQEEWDNSGWQIFPEYENENISKILLCLSLTKDILSQAKDNECDLIISHHPLIFPHCVPISFNVGIPIYSAHTNLDKAQGGTTDSLINVLDYEKSQNIGDFLRLVELKTPISLNDFILSLKIKLNLFNVRVVNNNNKQEIKKIAFCAGAGADFIADAKDCGADILVTGDIKYHSALDSDVIIADIGHFESEKPVLYKLKVMLEKDMEVLVANEKSPFINY